MGSSTRHRSDPVEDALGEALLKYIAKPVFIGGLYPQHLYEEYVKGMSVRGLRNRFQDAVGEWSIRKARDRVENPVQKPLHSKRKRATHFAYSTQREPVASVEGSADYYAREVFILLQITSGTKTDCV